MIWPSYTGVNHAYTVIIYLYTCMHTATYIYLYVHMGMFMYVCIIVHQWVEGICQHIGSQNVTHQAASET